jgi:hypothetical protein
LILLLENIFIVFVMILSRKLAKDNSPSQMNHSPSIAKAMHQDSMWAARYRAVH